MLPNAGGGNDMTASPAIKTREVSTTFRDHSVVRHLAHLEKRQVGSVYGAVVAAAELSGPNRSGRAVFNCTTRAVAPSQVVTT